MIKPTARLQLTAADLDFIASTLAHNPESMGALLTLLASEEDRDEILDADALFERLQTDPNMTALSPSLYFYILVRRALKGFDIDDRDVADYIASMLAEFSNPQRAEMISKHHQKQYKYLVDLLQDLADSNNEQVFLIYSHLGNYSMFLAGIFPDHIYHRARYGRAAPDFSYYEQMGRSGYQRAASSRLANKWQLAGILEFLAAQFRLVRHALNYMSDNYMNIDRQPQGTDRTLRRVDDFIRQRRYFS